MKFVEITQDGAALLQAKVDDYAGVFTSDVETCVVRAFYGAEGLVVIHDTGQLSIVSIENLLRNIGEISACHIAHQEKYAGSPQYSEHQKRTKELQEICKTNEAPNYLNIPSGQVYFRLDGHLQSGFSATDITIAPPDVVDRKMINIINNLFSPGNSQSIPLDIQFKDGNFQPPPRLLLSKEKIRYRANKELNRGDKDYMDNYRIAESMGIFA